MRSLRLGLLILLTAILVSPALNALISKLPFVMCEGAEAIEGFAVLIAVNVTFLLGLENAELLEAYRNLNPKNKVAAIEYMRKLRVNQK